MSFFKCANLRLLSDRLSYILLKTIKYSTLAKIYSSPATFLGPLTVSPFFSPLRISMLMPSLRPVVTLRRSYVFLAAAFNDVDEGVVAAELDGALGYGEDAACLGEHYLGVGAISAAYLLAAGGEVYGCLYLKLVGAVLVGGFRRDILQTGIELGGPAGRRWLSSSSCRW